MSLTFKAVDQVGDQLSDCFDLPFQENRKKINTRTVCCIDSQSSMAQEVFNQDAKTSDTFEAFLNQVETGPKKPLTRTAVNGRDSQNGLLEQLEDALAQSDADEVLKLIPKINETYGNKTLEEINEVCKAIAERESNRENGCRFKCSWDCKKIYETITCKVDEPRERKTKMRSKEDRRWIEILSNPLYISLEWLWRNNTNSQYKKGKRRKESKFTDIIEAALDDAHLLEKVASYEHYYSRDEYKRRAEEYETFAADIVEQVDASDLNGQLQEIMDIEGNGALLIRNETFAADTEQGDTSDLNGQLHEIMDIEGSGPLLNKPLANFNQSLSLLKLAADRKRKRVGIRLDGVKLRVVIFTSYGNR